MVAGEGLRMALCWMLQQWQHVARLLAALRYLMQRLRQTGLCQQLHSTLGEL
jgi:uncharacterized coiled-coil protein SlyX